VTQRFLFLRRVTPLFRFCGAELCVFESLSRRSFFAAWRPFCFAMQRFLFFHPVTPLFLFAARSSVFCGTSLHSFFLQRGALCFLPRCRSFFSRRARRVALWHSVFLVASHRCLFLQCGAICGVASQRFVFLHHGALFLSWRYL